MWYKYEFVRGPCEDGCSRRSGAHQNNYWVCPACAKADKARQLEKLLRFYEIEAHRKQIKSFGPHVLKYRRQYVSMGGSIASFPGTAVSTCPGQCCWAFTLTAPQDGLGRPSAL